ncbi:MAG: hypothetical protein JSV82_01170 [Planctomycetota bacterium]|nr:MAG: hypothetical protein JSV82_01170 [Planctomycetota bacterium]
MDQINGLIEGEVYFSELSMSWWKGIKVTDFIFKDSAGKALVEAEQISTKPHYGSILMGSLSFGETIIDEPRVEINFEGRQPKGAGGVRGEVQKSNERGSIVIPIEEIELVVKGGSLKVTGEPAVTFEAAGINSRLAVSFSGEYPAGGREELLANLEVWAEFGFERAQYMGLNFGSTTGKIQMQDSLLQIGSFSSIVNNGRFNFGGEADFREEPTLFRETGPMQIAKGIQITDEVTRSFLSYLNPIFANVVTISGEIDFSCERLAIPLVGGSRNDAEVIGTVTIRQLRLEASDLLGEILSFVGVAQRGQDIVIEPTRFFLQDGFLRYDDMRMVLGNNPINFRGTIGLDRSLDMAVILPYTTRGETVRIGEEIEGVRISLPLKGTIDNPELDTGKLLEEQLKEELKGRLGEELKERLEDELMEKLLEEFDELLKP